jgi:CHAD domain-containing protein
VTDPEAISPEPWLAALVRRTDEVLRTHDERAVHQLRVAAGRLNVWLELGARAALRDDLRRIRRSVAELRDTDVLLARHPPDTEAARLRATRELAASRATTALRAARPHAVAAALAFVPWPTTAQAERALRRLGLRVVDAAEETAHGQLDPTHLHRFRRRVRRTRYALEWLGRDATNARELQDVLGLWHDATLDERRLESAPPESVESLRNALERERKALLERALETYATHRMWWRDLVGS